jgi:uncharacterized delta-60 repeat protein
LLHLVLQKEFMKPTPIPALIILFIFLFNSTLNSQPGQLDLGFGNNGKVTLDFNLNNDEARDIAIQSDGKILVAGEAYINFLLHYAVVRLNPDGTLDNTFGDNGKFLTLINGSQLNSLSCMILQPDGKILLGGSTFSENRWQIALVRLNSDATLDATFSSDGIATHIYGSSDFCSAIALQTDGKIIVAGSSGDPEQGQHFSVFRFNSNGTIDPTFGGGSHATSVGIESGALGVAIQNDGKIVMTGRTSDGVYSDVALVRYLANGTIDNTFDSDGIRTLALEPYEDYATTIIQLSSGKLLVGGISNTEFALMRFNVNGTLDNTFSNDGIVKADMNDSFDELLDFAIDAEGRIVAVGHSLYNLYDIAVLRFNANGTLDNLFSLDGKATVDFSQTYDYGYGVALQPDGKIVVAGVTDATASGNQNDFAILRIEANCPIINTNQSITICDGESVNVGGSVYTTAGNYSNTITLPSGCDSTINTSLTVLPNSSYSQNITINEGQSITVGNNTYTTTGIYTDYFFSANGCDSVVTTNLTVNTGIGNVANSTNEILVWPCPFTNYITLNNLMVGDHLVLLDGLGNKVIQFKAASVQTIISTEMLACGYYTLIHLGKRNTSALKLMKTE